MDSLDGIEVFVRVAEARSFTVAAQRLHLTRSAVGKTIARLEQRLGVRLFHRTTRRQSLTEEGRSFLARCVRALAEIEEGEALLHGEGPPRGTLRVSAPVVFGREVVAPILRALIRDHPRLSVELSTTDRHVDLLDQGFDLAVRVGELSTSLASRRLGDQHMAVIGAPAYLAAAGVPERIGDLAHHACLPYVHARLSLPWDLVVAGAARRIEVAGRLRCDNLDSILDAALAGGGLAWLPRWRIASHLRDGTLREVLSEARGQPRPIHALWPRVRPLPARTRVAIDALMAAVPRLIAPPAHRGLLWGRRLPS